MANLISVDLNNVLCEQIAHERYNSGLYMKIAGILKQKGLDGLAKHFMDQFEEENEHAKLIHNYITDLNGFINIEDVDGVVAELNTIVDIAKLYLDTEINTTNSLKEIALMAQEESDLVTWDFIMEMLKKQRTEYAEATTFLDNAELCGDDWYRVKVWNDSISK